jgi:ketosteroid isomerase-like protein
MKVSSDTEKAVREVLDALWDAFSRKDGDAWMRLFSVEEDVVLIGSGADEWRVGPVEMRANMERDFAQADSLWAIRGPQGVGRADVVWATCPASIRVRAGDEEVAFDIRSTVVMEQHDGQWRIAQFHGSLPAAEREEGSACSRCALRPTSARGERRGLERSGPSGAAAGHAAGGDRARVLRPHAAR